MRMQRLVAVLTCLATVMFGGTALAAPKALAAANGPDVSAWQHHHGKPINWRAVRAAGNSFAFIKATEGPSGRPGGTPYTNPWFAKDWQQAGAAGLHRGSYHFARPGLPITANALSQARYYIAVTGKHDGVRDLPPVLDLETTNGLSAAQTVAWAKVWLAEVERLTGLRAIIYSFPTFWRKTMHDTRALTHGHLLWLAAYSRNPKDASPPGGWRTWSFWQYTDRGHIPGIAGGVDMSHFCCDLDTLRALADPKPPGPPPGSPFGTVDTVERRPGGVLVRGWAIDPDTKKPIKIRTYADGKHRETLTADGKSTDVSRQFPGRGDEHRFATMVPVHAGEHRICVFGDNVSRGKDQALDCRLVDVSSNPRGSLDVLRQQPGGVRVAGWALDPDTTDSVPVHVYVDGKLVEAVTADQKRPDVATTHRGYGAAHGFALDVPVRSGGKHKVCVYALNVGEGDSHATLGCQQMDLRTSPYGQWEDVALHSDGMHVGGWAVDGDTNVPVWVHAYVDGRLAKAVWSSRARPDVGSAVVGYGVFHGFEAVVPWPKDGKHHRICLYALNAGEGSGHPALDCRTY